jgi:hypothetical protein
LTIHLKDGYENQDEQELNVVRMKSIHQFKLSDRVDMNVNYQKRMELNNCKSIS